MWILVLVFSISGNDFSGMAITSQVVKYNSKEACLASANYYKKINGGIRPDIQANSIYTDKKD